MGGGQRALSWFGPLSLLLGATVAWADEGQDKQRAGALMDQGNAEYSARRFQEAISAYQEAYAIYPSPKILLNLAQAEHANGRPDQAAAHYEAFLSSDRVPAEDPQRSSAEQRLEIIAKELGRVVFEEAEPGTLYRFDQGPPTPLPSSHLWAIPGRHELRLEREGATPLDVELEVGAGRKIPVRASLRPALPPAPPPAPPPAVVVAPPPPSEESITSQWWLWAGIAVVVAGGVVTAVALTTGGDDFVPGGELGRFRTTTWERVDGP